jgi:hypothetical protein
MHAGIIRAYQSGAPLRNPTLRVGKYWTRVEVIDIVNTLAYYKMELTMTVKSFIEGAPGLLTLF